MARLVTLPKKIVAPSGLALAARRAPIICVAPGLLSTTKVWPVCCASTSAMARGRMSPMPPAG
jgi:hypothetical protein